MHVISPDTSENEKARIVQELEKVIDKPGETSADLDFKELNCEIDYKIEERFSVSDTVIEATEQFERSPEVGIPSSKYLINQSINPNTFYSTLLVPGHSFSCFGVGFSFGFDAASGALF